MSSFSTFLWYILSYLLEKVMWMFLIYCGHFVSSCFRLHKITAPIFWLLNRKWKYFSIFLSFNPRLICALIHLLLLLLFCLLSLLLHYMYISLNLLSNFFSLVHSFSHLSINATLLKSLIRNGAQICAIGRQKQVPGGIVHQVLPSITQFYLSLSCQLL